MKKYIGLDVHCKQTVFVAQDSEGKVIKKGKVKTTPEGIAELLESVGAKKGAMAVLCEAAHCAARTNNPLNPYWRRIYGKGGYRKAVVAVSNRLARILWAMWRKGEAFNEGQLNVEFWPKRVARNYFYRLKPVACANCGQ